MLGSKSNPYSLKFIPVNTTSLYPDSPKNLISSKTSSGFLDLLKPLA